MTELASVQSALANVMAAMPAIGRDGRAAASQGGYAYRGIEQVTREVQGLLAANGVVIVPKVQSISVADITVQNKPWTDTTLIVDYLIVGPDGSKLEATTVGIGRDNSDKGANKAMTQAFKYLLLQLLCISDAKDDADGFTHEADGGLHRNPLQDRADAVTAKLTALDADGKRALREFDADRRGFSDWTDEWLTAVEGWLTERDAPKADA